jgi:methionyl-tRNA formyltransferase
MRTIFFGSGDIALTALQHLIGRPDIDLRAVVAQPDKPAGRKLALTPPETKTLALQHGVPVLQPEKVREILPQLAEYEPELYVVMAYGQILPQALLDQPSVACINLHASLLPKFRGAAPLQAAILAGELESGITIMHVAKGLDSGDIVLAESFPLDPEETSETLHEKLMVAAPVALDRAITAFQNQTATRTPQDPALVSHQGKLSREDGVLDWSQPAELLHRRIRAFYPWPGTSSTLQLPDGSSKPVKIFPRVEVVPGDGCPAPGTILAADKVGILVQCGVGQLRLTELQLEGRKRLAARDFIAGMPSLVGLRFI